MFKIRNETWAADPYIIKHENVTYLKIIIKIFGKKELHLEKKYFRST